jgi:uncharacterized membrane protein
MVTNEKSIIINRPVKEVFAYVCELQNGPKWQPALVEARRITKGSLGIGTQYTGVRKFMGVRVESVIEYTTYEQDEKISMKSISGNSPFEQSFVFESTDGGTQLTTRLDLQTSGLMGLAKPMIASGLRKEMDANFSNLKNILESQGTTNLS